MRLHARLCVLSHDGDSSRVAGSDHFFTVARANAQEQAAVFGDVQRITSKGFNGSLRLPLQERTSLGAERRRPLVTAVEDDRPHVHTGLAEPQCIRRKQIG